MKKYLVIGNPIEHSLSPKLHNYWFEKNNINANYDKRKIDKNEIQKIISEIKSQFKDLIKSQNLIDVRTPSFLNVKVKLTNKNNFAKFNNILKKIDLIDNYYIQQLNKDYVLIKIKYLGKIDKIINKLKDENIDLKMNEGQWQLSLT